MADGPPLSIDTVRRNELNKVIDSVKLLSLLAFEARRPLWFRSCLGLDITCQGHAFAKEYSSSECLGLCEKRS
jgi:hypothetical protein